MRGLFILWVCLVLGCGSESKSGDVLTLPDASVDTGPLMPVEPNCNETTRRADLDGPFACAAEPEYVEVVDRGRPFHIFKYEASHPLADGTDAFPCAVVQGESYEAPEGDAEACSVAGVIPWHSVRWNDANAACEAIGWRMCSRQELVRACQGPEGYAYTFGPTFEGGACNVREAYRGNDSMSGSVAPAGHFERCVSGEGAHDLTGNLWEWSNERDDSDGSTRFYHMAGWKTIAERHRDTDQVCNIESRIPGFSARSFMKEYVGFRCCRDVD